MTFIEWDEEDFEPEARTVSLDIADPLVIGVLLGPDGEPISYLLDRPAVPFGFQRPGAEGTVFARWNDSA